MPTTVTSADIDSFLAQAPSEMAKPKPNEYALSVYLMATARSPTKYNLIKTALNPLVDNVSGAYKAWLLGRILIAADHVGDREQAAATEAELKVLLLEEPVLQSAVNQTAHDSLDRAMLAWAYGYYAASSPANYAAVRDTLFARTQDLLIAPEGAILLQSESGNQERISNALWALVMSIQAAARAGAQADYETLMHKIITLTGKSDIQGALSCFVRTETSSDYGAWAAMMLAEADATIKKVAANEYTSPLLTTAQSMMVAAKEWADLQRQTAAVATEQKKAIALANAWKGEAEVAVAASTGMRFGFSLEQASAKNVKTTGLRP